MFIYYTIVYIFGDNISQNTEDIVMPKDLKAFLNDIVEKMNGYDIGEPWKFSDESLLVMVPITRKNAPHRLYTTMYEVLKNLGMKDTGSIDKVELQNKAGKAIFVRAGTIFAGKTQNRAAQNSGVYKDGMKVDIKVRCVHQTHGIRTGAEMEYGSIAPMSVTYNLMQGNQGQVWNSVREYTSGVPKYSVSPTATIQGISGFMGVVSEPNGTVHNSRTRNITYTASSDEAKEEDLSYFCGYVSLAGENYSASDISTSTMNTDDLLGYIKSQGKEALDEMMQKVPLFDDQAGAVIFNPTGVIALETFDSPKSWAAIKKEIIEKYGDKVSDKQAEHLFELNKDMILPMMKKFVNGLDKFEEKTVRQDDFSETRAVKGDKVAGEYTLIKGRTIHCLLIKE